MTQSEVYRAVARATGETISEVKHLGFGIADPDAVLHDPEPSDIDRYLDWDAVDAARMGLMPC